jgi:hypothetical protein
VQARQADKLGNLPQSTYMTKGGLIEGSLHVMGGKLHPYLRYDRTSLPEDGGPYLSLRQEAGVYTRVFVPNFEAVMSGVAYDLNQHTRLKGEIIRHMDGPRQRYGVAFQTAFGF